MTRRARHLLPVSPGRTERGGRVASRASAAGPAAVLALQRQAGNRAVVALLARTPRTKAPPEPKDDHVILPDIGTIPLLSYSWGGSGRDSEGQPGRADLSLSTEFGSHSSALMRATREGTRLGTVEVVLMKDGKPYARLKLRNAIITSYSTHGASEQEKPTETWSLTAEGIKWEFVGGDTSGAGGPRPEWDYGGGGMSRGGGAGTRY